MGYTIEKLDGFFEVRLSGPGSKFVIFKAIADLMRQDPKKEYPDLWIVAPEFQVPYSEFGGIIRALSYVFTLSLVSKKTALVADNDFQAAELELYRKEISHRLPIDMRVFRTLDAAATWIKTPETQPPG